MLVDAGMTTGIEIETTPISSSDSSTISADSSISSKGVVTDPTFSGDRMYQPVYYIADWIKAVIAVLLLTVVFFIEFHTTDCMYKWFVLSPL